MKRFRCLTGIALLWVLFLTVPSLRAHAGEQRTVYNSPFVSFSPDRLGWTTDAGDTDYQWYNYGDTVETGIRSSLRAPETGEHFYRYARQGMIPVGKWVVNHRSARCIHGNTDIGNYHDLDYGRKMCRRPYHSGWIGWCADCGERLTDMLVYMNRETAETLQWLDFKKDMFYYYLCPWCANLEQGVPMGTHSCKAVSANRYKVVYDPNTTGIHGGYMAPSWHMYNDATEYNGMTVTPVKNLTKNSYSRIGYEFAEWNTEPDGTGESYGDGARIRNLAAKEGEEVVLYAQWRPSRSALCIDPAGGRYRGTEEKTVVWGDYGSSMTLDPEAVTAPAGHKVSFDTNGGEETESLTGGMHFVEWIPGQPFGGTLRGNQYQFTAQDKTVDTVTARYEPDPVILPEPVKAGYSFGGWYYDKSFGQAAGGPGDEIVPRQDMTLYAQWVELVLSSRENYERNGGAGAVDLCWRQSDGKDKIYLVYQSLDGENWVSVSETGDVGGRSDVDVVFRNEKTARQFAVPATGRYTLTAKGAQGGGYGTRQGGQGGSVTADFWLSRGEILTVSVGGRDGQNGGGSATHYGNGGGYTSIGSDRKGILLTAGGGGGASVTENGGAGGSESGLVRGNAGQSGMAGGGGGFQGGSAGEYIAHHHNKQSSCYHAHTGSAEKGGGCYGTRTIKRTEKVCEPIMVYLNTSTWQHGVQCGGILSHSHYAFYGSNGCSQQHGHIFIMTCTVCGKLPLEKSIPGRHTFWEETEEYVLNCGREERYYCGYADGQVISSKPGQGGSSYVNTEYAMTYEMQAGVNPGDGSASVFAGMVGFLETLELSGVAAPDMAPPDKVSREVETEAAGGNKIAVRWKEPQDNGTQYFHRVESHLRQTSGLLCGSNITSDILISGVKGYYYLTDEAAFTRVTADNGIYTRDCCGFLELSEEAASKYLHVAAVDAAGNLGETTHISVNGKNGDVAWPLYTEPLEMEPGENVYEAREGVWYVKSDGETPFTLHYGARMEGQASLRYQPNYVIFESAFGGETAKSILFAPSCPISNREIRTEAEELTYAQEGRMLLERYPYSVVVRSGGNRELRATQKFLAGPELSGIPIEIFPAVGADRDGDMVCSDPEKDRGNGILIIGDAQAPVITGTQPLDDMELLDRRNGRLTLTVSATDGLSGLRELYVAIFNRDNAIERIYRPDEEGRIVLDITEDDPIFIGDFTVTVRAVDNVGNAAEIVRGVTEFALEAEVERILEPHEPVFRRGESGVLSFTVWGYADRVEVVFPEEMTKGHPERNRTFVYTDDPFFQKEERVQFMIPLDVPPNQTYSITVRAYKDGKKLEEHPAVGVIQVEGTVLDEFRTRLR